jgi:hypothetical protein
MRIASRTIASAAVVALLSPMMAQPAHAQRHVTRNEVTGIQILVRTIDDKSDGARINSGGTVTIAEGARVRVNVEAALNGSRTPMYPVTEFTDLNRGGIRISRGNAANAAVDLEVLSMRNPNRIQRIGYRITDNRVPVNLRTGSFNIQVSAPARTGSYDQGGTGYTRPDSGRPGYGGDSHGGSYGGTHGNSHGGNGAWSGTQARDLTAALYQGILMRDLDSGASGTIDAVRNGGYDALVQAAADIVRSDESRNTIPQRGVTPEQRLESIYRSLLGLSPQQAQDTWRSDLQRVNNGQLLQVVEGILRSDRFRSRYNITG